MADKWTFADMTDQSDRVAIVTGANSGLGLVATRELARRGGNVVMACRDKDKGVAALRAIEREIPDARLVFEALDLASLDSVRRFAEHYRKSYDGLDLLINNAGVMATPRLYTHDGFELQFGTNHLGHFALSALMIGEMEGSVDARVVTVSSPAHRMGRIAFDNLDGEKRYNRWRAYGQSKLANLLFAMELDRRLRAAGSTIKSVAAHPGYARTNLQHAGPPRLDELLMLVPNYVIAQSAAKGALPILYAATEPGLEGGDYIGPDGIAEQRGHPKRVGMSGAARDEQVARRLWEVSERMTGVRFELTGAAA
jgi:NAD(P)-dependent dehydrogenase (short-subunit alcohol dehydrogenase family)